MPINKSLVNETSYIMLKLARCILITCALLYLNTVQNNISAQTVVLEKSNFTPFPDVEETFNFVIDISCSSSTGPCSDIVVRDTLPSYLEFLNFSTPLPAGVDEATYDPNTREAVITLDKNTGAGSSIQMNIQVRFPYGTLIGSEAINYAYATSGNAGSSQDSAMATANTGFPVGDFPDNKGGGSTEVTGGYQYWQIDVGNIGFTTIDNYSVVDTLPADMTLDQIRTPEFGSLNHTGNLYYQRSDNPGIWNLWTAFNLNNRQSLYVSGLGLPAGEYVTMVRLDLNSVLGSGAYNPYIYPDGFRRGWTLYAFESGGRTLGDSYTNCAYYSGTSSGLPISDVDCITTTIIEPIDQVGGNGYPVDATGSAQNVFSIGDTMNMALEFYSPSPMGYDIVGGVMTAVLPPNISYIPNSWFFDFGEHNADFQTPVVETGTLLDGREFVRFVFDSIHNNSFTIEPSAFWEGFRINISGFISPAAMEGNYDIEYYYYAAHSVHDNCNVNDVDNYLGGYSTFVCREDSGISIIRPPGSAGLQSSMEVIGTLDTDYSQYPERALTVPGGISDYRITIKNPNPTRIDRLVFITVLPHIGDTEVLDISTPRSTEWQPSLAEAVITGISGLSVEYSTEVNPCRDDLAGSNPTPFPTGCNTANWSATPPADITDVTALRFDYGNTNLNQGDSLVVSFSMRSPVDALPDTSIAWNSFAYSARNFDDKIDLLPAEPIKVGIELRPGNVPIVGDFVWEDEEPNGQQDASEQGIDGIRVELFEDVDRDGIAEPTGPDTVVLWTVTSAGGKYLFSDFDFGYYFIQFSDIPSGFNPTYQDAAADSIDSDGLITDIMLFDNTVETYDIDLGLYDGILPEDCTNGSDDDGDGLIDCFDSDCITSVAISDPGDECEDGIDLNFTGFPTDSRGSFSTTASSGLIDNLDGTAILDVSSAGAGVYDVYYHYLNDGGCTFSDTISIEILESPRTEAGPDRNICIGENTVLLAEVNDGDGNYTYNWTPAGGLSSFNVLQPTASPNITTTYTLSVQDGNGCISTDSVVVVVSEIPDVEIVANVPCEGQPMRLLTTPIGGDGNYDYSWTGPNGFTSILRSPIITNFQAVNEGLYELTLTDGNACSIIKSATVFLCDDFDDDGIANGVDIDDDNDGIPDVDECNEVGPNLIANGDFEQGYRFWTSDFNRGRNNNGPTSDGCSTQGWVALSPCATGNGICDPYYSYFGGTPAGGTVITDAYGTGANVIPTANCNVSSQNCMPQILPDHTTGTGLSLYVDPSDVQGRTYWANTVTVLPFTDYKFSAWIMVIEEDPNLVFKINGVSITNDFNLDRLTPGVDGPDLWQEVATIWSSGSNSGIVTIELVNNTAGCGGNDIRLDDVFFAEVTCDCDGDGRNNFLDLDSDNDGIYDAYEAGHTENVDPDGRLTGAELGSGPNGLYDNLETGPESSIINYVVADSEETPDGIIDACELDADGDGCFDTREAQILDSDQDGIAGTGSPSINGFGSVSTITYTNPPNYRWQDYNINECALCNTATMNPHIMYYRAKLD